MKKLITIFLALTILLSMSMVTYAAPASGSEPNQPGGPRGSRLAEDGSVRPSDAPTGERPRGANLSMLFELYYPEGLAAFDALNAEHQEFHLGQAAIRDAHKAEIQAMKADTKAQFDAINAALEAGTITEEEAIVQKDAIRSTIEEKRAENSVTRAALEVIKTNKQAEVAAINALREANRTTLRTALTSDPVDEVAIASSLATVTSLLEQHIAVDYTYAAQIADLLGL
jgi:hypothetical protein